MNQIKRIFNPKGGCGRKEYWLTFIGGHIYLQLILFGLIMQDNEALKWIGTLLALAGVWVLFLNTVKRLRDANYPPALSFLIFSSAVGVTPVLKYIGIVLALFITILAGVVKSSPNLEESE